MKKILISLSLIFCILMSYAQYAHARYCTLNYPAAVGGVFWIQTVGNQPVNFRFYGSVAKIRLYGYSSSVLYEGAPVDSWNAAGEVGIEVVEAQQYSTMTITTDWAAPLPDCK